MNTIQGINTETTEGKLLFVAVNQIANATRSMDEKPYTAEDCLNELKILARLIFKDETI